MSETMIAPPLPEEQPAKSFLSRLIGVFVSPAETFDDIARWPSFLAPMVTILLASCVLFDTMYWKVGMETMTRLQLERSPFASKMPPEQIEKAISDSAGHLLRSLIITDVFIVIVTIIVFLILAGLGMMIVNAIFGGQVKFKTLFSVVSFAELPGLRELFWVLLSFSLAALKTWTPESHAGEPRVFPELQRGPQTAVRFGRVG